MGEKYGTLPVYLNYCGAHTTRWSGGGGVNFQNLPRGGDLRRALMAPPGHKLAIVDLSQIECRILSWLAGEQDVLTAFREGRDLYSEGASRFYGRQITRAEKLERHLGKTLELGCGFGMGAVKLRATCRAGALGGPPIILSESDSQRALDTYRDSHRGVVQYWKDAGRILSRLAGGPDLEWGPMLVSNGRIILPNGAPLIYETIEFDQEWNAWKIKNRNGWTKMYGGRLVENVVQALARVVVSQAMNRITAQGIKIVLCAHDELVACLPDTPDISSTFEFMKEEMKREPAWLPNIPLDVEAVLADRYEK